MNYDLFLPNKPDIDAKGDYPERQQEAKRKRVAEYHGDYHRVRIDDVLKYHPFKSLR